MILLFQLDFHILAFKVRGVQIEGMGDIKPPMSMRLQESLLCSTEFSMHLDV